VVNQKHPRSGSLINNNNYKGLQNMVGKDNIMVPFGLSKKEYDRDWQEHSNLGNG